MPAGNLGEHFAVMNIKCRMLTGSPVSLAVINAVGYAKPLKGKYGWVLHSVYIRVLSTTDSTRALLDRSMYKSTISTTFSCNRGSWLILETCSRGGIRSAALRI